MDNLTHTLFAVTLGRTPLARAGRGVTAVLVLSSNAPDIDIVTTARGATSYLQWHRGPTHGPLGLAALAILSAAIVWLWQRASPPAARPEPVEGRANGLASFGMLLAVSAIGVVCHVLMDVPTSYGTRLLSPFTWRWYAVDLMPIVDIYLLAALLAGLVFGRQSPAGRRRNAAIVILLMAANYGVRAVAHHRALTRAPRLFGPTLPPPCAPQAASARAIDSWPRLPPAAAREPGGGRCLVDIAALPSFVSPFRWRIIAQLSNAYEAHDVDLLDGRLRELENRGDAPWRLTIRYPNIWTPAVYQAAGTRLGRVYLGFSRFPAVRSLVDANGTTIVRWTDVRFAGAADRIRPVDPFAATVRFAADGRVLSETLGR